MIRDGWSFPSLGFHPNLYCLSCLSFSIEEATLHKSLMQNHIIFLHTRVATNLGDPSAHWFDLHEMNIMKIFPFTCP